MEAVPNTGQEIKDDSSMEKTAKQVIDHVFQTRPAAAAPPPKAEQELELAMVARAYARARRKVDDAHTEVAQLEDALKVVASQFPVDD